MGILTTLSTAIEKGLKTVGDNLSSGMNAVNNGISKTVDTGYATAIAAMTNGQVICEQEKLTAQTENLTKNYNTRREQLVKELADHDTWYQNELKGISHKVSIIEAVQNKKAAPIQTA